MRHDLLLVDFKLVENRCQLIALSRARSHDRGVRVIFVVTGGNRYRVAIVLGARSRLPSLL